MLRLISRCLYAASLISSAIGRSDNSVIIDTDIYADVDDVGALAIANVLHNCGLCNLRGIAINTPSKYGALAVSAINTYYNNPQIPIAALKPLTNSIYIDEWFFSRSDYASKLATHFPHSLSNASDTETPLQLYTRLLQSASINNNSITIISLGFLTNLAALLSSPDGLSLIASKVRKLVIMGGTYPGPGWEFNFGQDPSASASVLQNWPSSVPITFIGFELGIDILSGSNLKRDAPTDSPILAAYEWFVGRCSTTRESWDPVTVLYSVLGIYGDERIGVERLFEYGNEGGYNRIVDESDGTNVWVDDDGVRNQRWLKLAKGVRNITVVEVLDRFYVYDPGDESCFGLGGTARTEL